MTDLFLPAAYVVRRMRRETADVFTIGVAPSESHDALAFRPGQFTMLYAHGVGEVPISLSGDPHDATEYVHTIRAVGPVTRSLERLASGETVGLRGPYGTAWPVELAVGRTLLLVAGGIGLAPLRPVVYEALAARERFARVVLVCGIRSPAHLLYAEEHDAWRARGLELHLTADSAPRSWKYHVGLVTDVVQRLRFDPASTVPLICGPEVMIRFTARALEDRGIPASQIHVSLERNMKCGAGLCGRCQLGPVFVCRDGPVFPFSRVASLLSLREV